MSVDRIRCACAVALLLACPLPAAAAAGESSSEGTTTGPTTQLWANLTLGKMTSRSWYVELDVEPKVQLTSGEEWRNLDITPFVEFYPTQWLDLSAELGAGVTRQRDGLDTFELTPRIGAKLHFFGMMVERRAGSSGPAWERLPLTRLGLATLLRMEWRNFFYSDDTASRHEWRARLRLESRLAINHAQLAADRTFYAMADVEYFEPLGDDIVERHVNKVRTRLGFGFRHSAATRLELLYIRDWNRSAPDGRSFEEAHAVDLRLKLFF